MMNPSPQALGPGRSLQKTGATDRDVQPDGIYITADWNLEPDFGKSQYPEKDPVFAGQISIKKIKNI